MAHDDSIRFRRATDADAERLAIGVIEGVEDYRSFARRCRGRPRARHGHPPCGSHKHRFRAQKIRRDRPMTEA
jgi:hypothetical protein